MTVIKNQVLEGEKRQRLVSRWPLELASQNGPSKSSYPAAGSNDELPDSVYECWEYLWIYEYLGMSEHHIIHQTRRWHLVTS